MGRPRTWTDDQLRQAVVSARCLADVMRSLGVKQQRTVIKRAEALGLTLPIGKPASWDDQAFRDAVGNSTTIREALAKLGIEGRGANYRTFHRHAERLGIDTSHLTGRAHLAGIARKNLKSRRPLDLILVAGSTYENTKRLGQRLVKEGVLEARCGECRGTEWRGQAIPLELDHVNGDRRDLRLENLRFLCPNCHALTPTYRGRNATKERRKLRAAG